MTKKSQTSIDASRSVEVAEAIFECLTCGIEVPYNLLADAESLGVNIEAIREKVEELYGEDEDESADTYC